MGNANHWLDLCQSFDDYFREEDYRRAVQVAAEAAEVAAGSFGANHRNTAESFNLLATALDAMGEYAKARTVFERALTVGWSHRLLIETLARLASVYMSLGEPAKAAGLCERAMALEEAAREPWPSLADVDLATIMARLAWAYRQQGEVEKAAPLDARAQKIIDEMHDEVIEHVWLNELARIAMAEGDAEKALALLERAQKLREAGFGLEFGLDLDPRETLLNLDNLAALYDRQGDLSKAESLYKRALEVREALRDPNSYAVFAALDRLAKFEMARGAYAQAVPVLERLLALAVEANGPDAPSVASWIEPLAECYRAIGRDTDAERIEARAARIHADHARGGAVEQADRQRAAPVTPPTGFRFMRSVLLGLFEPMVEVDRERVAIGTRWRAWVGGARRR